MIVKKDKTCEADASVSVASRAISIFELDNLEDAQNWKMKYVTLMLQIWKTLKTER